MKAGNTTERPLLNRTGDIVILIVGLLFAWQFVHEFAGGIAMTAPLDTLRFAVGLLATPDFWPHVLATGSAFVTALVIAAVAGTVLGAIFGIHRITGEVVDPLLVALYSIPKVALYPIILMFFGLGMRAEVAFGALHGIVPIMMLTMSAVRNIKPVYIKAARTMRLSPTALLMRVLIPAALPEIFTGFRVGFSVTLVGTLISEMFGSKRGIGYMLMQALGVNNMIVIMSITILLVAFAAVMNMILMTIERRLYRRVN